MSSTNCTPQNLTVTTSQTCGGDVDLSWNPVAGASYYNIYYFGFLVDSVSAPATTYTWDGGGSNIDQPLDFQVSSVDGSGYESALSNTAEADSSDACPAPPQGLTAQTSNECGDNIDLSWQQVTKATGYNVYRLNYATGNYESIADNFNVTADGDGNIDYTDDVSGLSDCFGYDDNWNWVYDPTCNSTQDTTHEGFSYEVSDITSYGGESPLSSPSSSVIGSKTCAVPQDFTVSTDPECGGNVDLSWSPVDGAASYNIYLFGSQIDSVSATTTYTYQGNGYNTDQPLDFQVSSVDDSGNESVLSNTAEAESSDSCPSFACSPSPNPASIGDPVTWTASVNDNNGPFTYNWGDSNGNITYNGGDSTTTSYGSGGYQSMSLQVLDSNGNPIPVVGAYDPSNPWEQCSDEYINPAPLSVTCAPDPSSAEVGEQVTWNANITGGSGDYFYDWYDPSSYSDYYDSSVTDTYDATGTENMELYVYDYDTGAYAQDIQCTPVDVGSVGTPSIQISKSCGAGGVNPSIVVSVPPASLGITYNFSKCTSTDTNCSVYSPLSNDGNTATDTPVISGTYYNYAVQAEGSDGSLSPTAYSYDNTAPACAAAPLSVDSFEVIDSSKIITSNNSCDLSWSLSNFDPTYYSCSIYNDTTSGFSPTSISSDSGITTISGVTSETRFRLSCVQYAINSDGSVNTSITTPVNPSLYANCYPNGSFKEVR